MTNPTHFIIFPVGEEAAADAYLALCNDTSPIPVGEWYWPGVVDAYGQRVVAKLGAPWRHGGVVFPETAELLAARAVGVEHDNWVAPPPEE